MALVAVLAGAASCGPKTIVARVVPSTPAPPDSAPPPPAPSTPQVTPAPRVTARVNTSISSTVT